MSLGQTEDNPKAVEVAILANIDPQNPRVSPIPTVLQ
jgi:hypothetical protein